MTIRGVSRGQAWLLQPECLGRLSCRLCCLWHQVQCHHLTTRIPSFSCTSAHGDISRTKILKIWKIWSWVSNSKIPEVSWVGWVFHYLMQCCVCWPMLCDWRIVQWVSIKLHKSEDSKHERKVQPKDQSGADQCLKTFRHCVWKHNCQAENSLLSIQIASLQKCDQPALQQMALWSLWGSFNAKP